MSQITIADIKHLAKLASLPINDDRLKALVEQIETVYEYVATLKKTDTANIKETNQVTGQTNVWRDDVVDETRTLSQEEALQNAPKSYQGYFLVPAVLE